MLNNYEHSPAHISPFLIEGICLESATCGVGAYIAGRYGRNHIYNYIELYRDLRLHAVVQRYEPIASQLYNGCLDFDTPCEGRDSPFIVQHQI